MNRRAARTRTAPVAAGRLLAACVRVCWTMLQTPARVPRVAVLLTLCALCACAGPKYWSFGFSSSLYGGMSTSAGSGADNPMNLVLFLLPLVLDLIVLPVAAMHDLFVYMLS